MSLKHVFVLKIPKDLDNLVELFGDLRFLKLLNLLFKDFVEVAHKSFGSFFIRIAYFLKSKLDGHINLRILIHRNREDGEDCFS